ncbi:hypothetical protein [Agaribacterium haliotis]|uniref:hypothetical protein n=1 Tax=Agaribacterium haliotis TaxID=2013869 RepID=UPI000BB52F59|nr:hypothetical protein [Agaribacterium haliotis]
MALAKFARASGLALLFVFVQFLYGCASLSIDMHQTANELSSLHDAETVYSKVKHAQSNGKSAVEHQLNLGYMALVTGRFDEAISELEQAKQGMKKLDAVSVTESAGAVTINETTRSYAGTPTDHTLVHAMLAMAYLMKGDIDGARVEVLQSDVTMKKLAERRPLSGQLASMHSIAGLVYELNGERDNAMISYRHAYELLNKRSETIPEALQLSLLKLSQALGLGDEYRSYQQRFSERIVLQSKQKQQSVLVYFDGVISQMQSHNTTLWWDVDEVYLSVALPRFPANTYHPRELRSNLASSPWRTEVIEDLELRVREDLDASMGRISATALARAANKYMMVKKAQEQDNILGAVANVLTLVSEYADTRQWALLPSSIQLVRADAEHVQQLLNTVAKTPMTADRTISASAALADDTFNVILLSGVAAHYFTAAY